MQCERSRQNRTPSEPAKGRATAVAPRSPKEWLMADIEETLAAATGQVDDQAASASSRGT